MKDKVHSENVTCGHCGNISKMELIGSVNDVTNTYEDLNGPEYTFYDIYEILKCPKCEKMNIRTYAWSDFADSDHDNPIYINLFPANNEIPSGLPMNISKTYRAAETIKKIDANAYGTVLRRLLEMVCFDRKAKQGTLAKMLQELATKGEIPQNLVDVANALRNLGNIGAHAGPAELSEDEVPILKALADAILEYVYSAPDLVKKVTIRLDELKKIKK